jgi:Fibronectin type III domain
MVIFTRYSGNAHAGDATLTWTPPTSHVDGTPLADLAGYKVYYGTSSGYYGTSIDVGNQTSFTLRGLDPGTYYFTTSAYDSSGNESGLSMEASKTFSGQAHATAAQQTSFSGGCGTIFQKNGKPPGPGEAADMLALVAVGLITILKSGVQSLKFTNR